MKKIITLFSLVIITAINYENNLTVGGFNDRNNSLSGNYTKFTDNGWSLNMKAVVNQSDTVSAHSGGSENDDSNNIQLNLVKMYGKLVLSVSDP